MRIAEFESDSLVFQETPHAARSFQAESTAAGERHGVNAIRNMKWIENIPFFGSGSGAADVAAGDGSRFAQYDRTPGQSVIIGNVTYQDAGDVGKTLHGNHMLASTASGDLDCSTF